MGFKQYLNNNNIKKKYTSIDDDDMWKIDNYNENNTNFIENLADNLLNFATSGLYGGVKTGIGLLYNPEETKKKMATDVANTGMRISSIGKGLSDISEGLSDTLLYGIADINENLGNQSYADALRKRAGEKSNAEQYVFNPVENNLKDFTTVKNEELENLRSTSSMFGKEVLLSPLTIATGGVGRFVAQPLASASLTYGQSRSTAYNSALENGMSEKEAEEYSKDVAWKSTASDIAFRELNGVMNIAGSKILGKMNPTSMIGNIATTAGVRAGGGFASNAISGEFNALLNDNIDDPDVQKSIFKSALSYAGIQAVFGGFEGYNNYKIKLNSKLANFYTETGAKNSTEARQKAFEILGVDEKASVDEINKAYRNLAKQYHSDITGNSDDAMRIINQAKEIALGGNADLYFVEEAKDFQNGKLPKNAKVITTNSDGSVIAQENGDLVVYAPKTAIDSVKSNISSTQPVIAPSMQQQEVKLPTNNTTDNSINEPIKNQDFNLQEDIKDITNDIIKDNDKTLIIDSDDFDEYIGKYISSLQIEDEDLRNEIYEKVNEGLRDELENQGYQRRNEVSKTFYDKTKTLRAKYDEFTEWLDNNNIEYETSKSTVGGLLPSIYIKDSDGNTIARIANHANRDSGKSEVFDNSDYLELDKLKDYVKSKLPQQDSTDIGKIEPASGDEIINKSASMQEIHDAMVDAFYENGLKDYYADEGITTPEQWIEKADVDEITTYLENTEKIQDKYLNKIPNYLSGDVLVEELVDAYKKGTLIGNNQSEYKPLDLSNEDKLYYQKNIYNPQERSKIPEDVQREYDIDKEYSRDKENFPTEAKYLYDKAKIRAVGVNRQKTLENRNAFIINAHNPDFVQDTGLTKTEINQATRKWANYPARAREISQSVNNGVSPQNQWTGLENSNILNASGVTDDELKSMVKDITGDSDKYQRKYITSTFLAFDTQIDYKGLTINFRQGNRPDGVRSTVNGQYHPESESIDVFDAGQNTVAHEITHHIDHLWGRELLDNNNGLTYRISTTSKKFQNLPEEKKNFINNFYKFLDSLESTQDKRSRYTRNSGETFARFGARFVEWTKNTATGNRFGYEEKYYDDNFNEGQYRRFIRILQEKAKLDTTNQVTVQNATDSDGNRLTPSTQKYFANSQAKIDSKGQLSDEGKLATVYHTTTDNVAQFNEFNPVGTPYYRFGDQVVNYYTDSSEMSGSYANNRFIKANTTKFQSLRDVQNYLDEFNQNTFLEGNEIFKLTEQDDGTYRLENKDVGGVGRWHVFENKQDLYKNIREQLGKMIPTGWNKNIQYSGHVNITNPFIVDGENRNWNNVSRGELPANIAKEKDIVLNLTYEEQQKLRDLDKVAYHEAVEKKNTLDRIEYALKTDRNSTQVDMINDLVALDKDLITLQLQTTIDDVETIKPELNEIRRTISRFVTNGTDNSLSIEESYPKFLELMDSKVQIEGLGEDKNLTLWGLATKYQQALIDNRRPFRKEYFNAHLHDALGNKVYDLPETVKTDILYDLANTAFLDEAMINHFYQNEFQPSQTTNDIVKQVIESNKSGKTNYDGVIIKNVTDYGGPHYGNEPANLYVTFNSNQFKALDNLAPTGDKDIRYSIGDNNYGKNWIKYKKEYETNGADNVDVDALDIALKSAPANKNNTRTIPVWRKVAHNFGEQLAINETETNGMKALENLERNAYISYIDLQPLKSLSRYNSETKGKVPFIKYSYKNWVEDVKEGYFAQSSKNFANETETETKLPTQKTQTLEEYYESLENEQGIPTESTTIENEPVLTQEQQVTLPTGNKPPEPHVNNTNIETQNTPEEHAEIAKVLTQPFKKQNPKARWTMVARANFLDKGSVFEDLSLKTGNKELQAKWDDTLDAEARAQFAICNNRYELDKNTKSKKLESKALTSIIDEVGDENLTDFQNYMYHQLNIDRMTLNQRFGIDNKPVFGDNVSAETSKSEVAKLEKEHPEFKQYAQDVYDYLNTNKSVLVKSDVISQELSDKFAEMYPHYVPISRVDTNGNAINVPLDTGRTGVNNPIKKAKGGNQDIQPLFETIAERTKQTYRASARNEFGLELLDTLEMNNNLNIKGNESSNVDTIVDEVTDSNRSDLTEGNVNTNEKPTFTVFRNGEKVTYEISPEHYQALKPRDPNGFMAQTDNSKIAKAIQGFSSFRRGLITEYNPLFTIMNGTKDAQDVLINSQHPGKTYAKFPEAYAQIIKKGYWYDEYVQNGGDSSSYFKDGEFEKNKVKLPKAIEKAKNIVKMPLEAISKVNNVIEMAPRLAEYIASREQGKTISESKLDASRVTTNFKAGGDITKFANRNGFTFLNASVQGFNQQVRNIREANANGLKGWTALLTKAVIASVPAIALNALLWGDDEDYDELSDYIKDNYYILGKGEDGTFFRLPKGRAVSVIQKLVNTGKDYITGEDEVNWNKITNDAWENWTFAVDNLAPNNPLQNNVLSPILDVAKNKTWYGSDLVPQRLQDEPAQEQFDESTDKFSVWLGQTLGWSPYKINYLLDQYSGGIGDVLLPLGTPQAENNAVEDKFTSNSVMKNKYPGEFYDTYDKLKSEANKTGATDEDILKNKYFGTESYNMNQLYKKKREIQLDENLTDEDKKKQVIEVQKQINDLAKTAIDNLDKITITGDKAQVGEYSYTKQDDGSWKKDTKKKSLSSSSGKLFSSNSNSSDKLFSSSGNSKTKLPTSKSSTLFGK